MPTELTGASWTGGTGSGHPRPLPTRACVWGGPGASEAIWRGRQSSAAAQPTRLQGGFYFLSCGCQVPEQIFSWSGGAAELPALSAGNTGGSGRFQEPEGERGLAAAGGGSLGLPLGCAHPPGRRRRGLLLHRAGLGAALALLSTQSEVFALGLSAIN